MTTHDCGYQIVRFGEYRFDPVRLDLRKSETRIRLETKPAQVLALLVSRSGHLVTRQELRSALWPDDVHLDFEHALNKSIHKLRSVLSDDAANPRFIERVSGRGYRFIAPVEHVEPMPVEPAEPVAFVPAQPLPAAPAVSSAAVAFLVSEPPAVSPTPSPEPLSERRQSAKRLLKERQHEQADRFLP